ncbi:undecaprenyl-diphosphatase [Paenibacillus sp. J31TS4]|uniref:undecaprenyl-diphosphatase n=1 Tax=Paenibacillus sp. J31TS4 TaxID=2807195 RepID=UPI001B0B8426|nr:undecaprenyl-diphosphatase [Paenibacillus sp. J31TS4]GIP39404.1 undecaprenyl-diphosphatase [Paenibacillus sp. J31TS4]
MNYEVFQWINGLAGRVPALDSIMKGLAEGVVWVLLALLVLLWISGKQTNQQLVFYSCLTALVVIALSKYVISPLAAHPRPFAEHAVNQLVPHEADFSFPSDHTAFAFSLAIPVWFLKRRLGTIMVVLAALTGIARIYVGVHYPADIAGGIVLAFLVAAIVVALRRRIEPIPNGCIAVYSRLTRRVPFLPASRQDASSRRG